MKFTKLAAAAVLVAGAGFGAAAHAVPTLTTPGVGPQVFTGFDWSSSAAAWTSGFSGVVGSTHTLYYAAAAVSVTDGGGQPETFGVDGSANGTAGLGTFHEFTIFATLVERVVSCGLTSCSFELLSGSFDIYYDTARNANQGPGTGYLDGTKIISGSVVPTAVGQTFDNATGGAVSLQGLVSYTNGAFISPVLTGSTLTSTIQLGQAQTSFTFPTAFDFNNDGTGDALGVDQVIVFQADANQTFTDRQLPEPASLLLAATALLGLGFGARRNKKS